jgi:catechol 2,3-dioxygenase-like lactoylglutathione lyase family enzyme
MMPVVDIERSNTILYCDKWEESVSFFRDILDFGVSFSNDWFIEFELGDGSFLSIANARRATIPSSAGAGLTLSWRVVSLQETHRSLVEAGAEPAEIHTRWGASAFHIIDPEGHRIEFWSDLNATRR